MKRLAPLLLCLALVLTACPKDDDAVVSLAKGLNVIAESVGTIQKVTIAANENGSLSDELADSIMQATLEISEAGRKATRITRSLVELGQADQDNLAEILDPIMAVVEEVLTSDQLFGDMDAQERDLVMTSFGTIEATLETVQIILEADQ
ncbi:MAG: hypothetical protein U1D99_05055 [Candidatus Omnitrophota bacterium]|nr:hypothetical protein [Candidatus Omnitrophota bacterium]